jgi:hypothetical protein
MALTAVAQPAHAASTGRVAQFAEVRELNGTPYVGINYKYVLSGAGNEVAQPGGTRSTLNAACAVYNPNFININWTYAHCYVLDATTGARYYMARTVPPFANNAADARGSFVVPTGHDFMICVRAESNFYFTDEVCGWYQ